VAVGALRGWSSFGVGLNRPLLSFYRCCLPTADQPSVGPNSVLASLSLLRLWLMLFMNLTLRLVVSEFHDFYVFITFTARMQFFEYLR